MLMHLMATPSRRRRASGGRTMRRPASDRRRSLSTVSCYAIVLSWHSIVSFSSRCASGGQLVLRACKNLNRANE